MGDFVQIFGSKCWALGGLNQKIEEKRFCRGAHGELAAKKMARFHRETKKKKKQFEGV